MGEDNSLHSVHCHTSDPTLLYPPGPTPGTGSQTGTGEVIPGLTLK